MNQGFRNVFLQRFGFDSSQRSNDASLASPVSVEGPSSESAQYSSFDVFRQMIAHARARAEQQLAAMRLSLQRQRMAEQNAECEDNKRVEESDGRGVCVKDVERLCPSADSFLESAECVYRHHSQVSTGCLSWLEDKPVDCVPDLLSLCSESVSTRQAMRCMRENYIDLSSRCRASIARAQIVGFRNRFAEFRHRLEKLFASREPEPVEVEVTSNAVSGQAMSIPVLTEVSETIQPSSESAASHTASFRALQSNEQLGSSSSYSRNWWLIMIASGSVVVIFALLLWHGDHVQVKPLPVADECASDSDIDSAGSVQAPLIVLPSAPILATVTGPVRG
jgi:hypothetical protein